MNHHLINKLNTLADWWVHHNSQYGVRYASQYNHHAVCREAVAEIERLEEKIGQSNSKYVQLASGLKETNDKYNDAAKRNEDLLKMYASAVEERGTYKDTVMENIRLEAAAKDRDEEIKDLKDILAGRNDTVDTVVKLNDVHIREKIRLKERVEELEKSFPGYETVHIKPEELFGNSGLTERDHIAIAAMGGLISNGLHNSENIARLAYQQADAMLKAREK